MKYRIIATLVNFKWDTIFTRGIEVIPRARICKKPEESTTYLYSKLVHIRKKSKIDKTGVKYTFPYSILTQSFIYDL